MTEPEDCGYVFASRSETLREYGERLAKNPAGPDPAAVAEGGAHRFRVTAGFAEHDERLGATASIEVRQPAAPTRQQAERLIWPVIWRVTQESLGPGDWRPSMNWLDVVELSAVPGGEPPDPAEAECAVRELRAAGRLAAAAALTGLLGPYGVADGPDSTTSLGAAVFEAYGDQLAGTDPGAADDAYRRGADEQRSFAAAATSGGEGIARMTEAARIDAKRRG